MSFNNGFQITTIFKTACIVSVLIAAMMLASIGCNSALSNASLPPIEVEGWTNGGPPTDLRGNVVVIDVFATWCVPCIQQTPELVKLHDKYKDQGVKFVAVTDETDGALSEINMFAEQLGVPWPIGYGGRKFTAALKVSGYPTVFVVARDGTVVWNSLQLTGTLEGAIRQVL